MELIETARNWIIQEKTGLLSKEELITLADSYIVDNDDYPYWIQKISLNESLAGEPRLDLAAEPVNEKDCPQIATKMLDLYEQGKLNTHRLASIAYAMCQSLDWECDAYKQFMWIHDGVDLLEQGVETKEAFESGIRPVLKAIIAL